MKTVGIVTFFKANNYGVCLQAIATQRFIQKCGYEAEIIRYSNPYEHASQKLCYKENDSFLGYFTSLAKNILLGKQHYYNMGFGRITDQMVLSDESYSAKEQMEKLEYDILVAGSVKYGILRLRMDLMRFSFCNLDVQKGEFLLLQV